MIVFDRVTYSYKGESSPVLSSVSFEIGEGENVGLIGANGAGKSTAMKLLLGLAGPGAGEAGTGGSVFVDGLPVIPGNLARIRRKLGFVLQNSDNQMFMPTVFEDVIFGLLNSGMSRGDAERRADAVLEQLGISNLKHQYNHRISGGEKRMAAIAAVLAMDPEVLLMDEPTSALDPYNRRVVINVIRALPGTKIITSHDLDMIYDTCGRVILLSGGRVAADGPAEEILRDRALLEANRMELPLRFQ
ncbi:MAG: ABC transporter ATP-binding protein [Lachnospiraceae bacterium]|nr:ABC transporter ATP-binding protein [Lachnospiraceae bacterium]